MNKKLLIAGLIGLVAAFEVQAKEWAFSMDALQLDVEVPVFEVAVPTMPESAPDRCDSAERVNSMQRVARLAKPFMWKERRMACGLCGMTMGLNDTTWFTAWE